MQDRYDVVVVGGGAAGLSGALTLARARRSVLVVDAGAPRNAPAGHVHGYLGREGTPPEELYSIGRAEVTSYGGKVITATVTTARRQDDQTFRVDLADGRSVLARRLLLATGLVDKLPDIPGLAERWGQDVLHCPYCHGWEVREQAIGVIAVDTAFAVHQAQMWRQWSSDVALFLHTAADPTAEQWEQLAARDIAVVDGEVVAVENDGACLTGVRLRSGRLATRQALVVQTHLDARTQLLTDLGLEATNQLLGGVVVGTAVGANPTGATSVPGVYLAGNVTNLMAQVVVAAAAGITTAAAVNADLIDEDTRHVVAEQRSARADRVATVFSAQSEREVSERVLGDRRHGLAIAPAR